MSFLTDTKGNITSLTFPLKPNVKDILFTRIPGSSSRYLHLIYIKIESQANQKHLTSLILESSDQKSLKKRRW